MRIENRITRTLIMNSPLLAAEPPNNQSEKGDGLSDALVLSDERDSTRACRSPRIEIPATSQHIYTAQDAYLFLAPVMDDLPQEQLHSLHLDTKRRLISCAVVYQGTVNETLIRIAEVFRPALFANAVSIILAHNHPSGDPQPSIHDIRVTRELVRAGKLLGLPVLDHLILGNGRFVSLRERGLLGVA